DHRAGRRAHDRLRPGCSLGGARESRNDQGCYKANDNSTHGASLVLVGQCSRLEPAGTAFPQDFAFFPAMKRYWLSAIRKEDRDTAIRMIGLDKLLQSGGAWTWATRLLEPMSAQLHEARLRARAFAP